MTTTSAQQVALDNALVPLEKGAEIGKCNMRINSAKTQQEPTYQVVLDALALTTCYPSFPITADVLEIYLHQFWFTINKKDLTAYRFKIDKKRYIIDMEVFREIFQICLKLSNQEFDALPSDEEIFSIIKEHGHKGDIKSITEVVVDQMYQPWITFVAIINKCLFEKITGLDKLRLLRAQILWGLEEEEPEPAKKVKKAPTTTDKSKGIDLLSEAAFIEKAQIKKALKRNRQETTIHQAGGSGDGADLQSEIPDELKGKSVDTHKGIGLKPGQDDEEDALEIDDDIHQTDDDLHSDDEQTETNNPRTSDGEDETQDEEYVHTPKYYVPTNDENLDDEEFERINEEMYSDVNVELRDSKHKGEGKDDEEMTDTSHEHVEIINVNQEGAGNQVKDDAQATQKTKVPLPNSSISSDYAAKFLNFDNIPLADTEVISMMDINVQQKVLWTSPLLTIPVSVIPEHIVLNPSEARTTNLEKDVKGLKNVDHSSALLSTIKSEVPNAVKEYLGTSVYDALYKHALIELILEDEEAMDKGVTKKVKKRKPDDIDKDEGPSAGSDRGLKRQRTSKRIETSKKTSATKDSSKGKSPATSSKSSKSLDNTDIPMDQGEYLGKTNEQPNDEAVSKNDWYKKSSSDSSLDPEWNEGKLVADGPKQSSLNDMAKATKSPLTFDELMHTAIDFSAFAMNRLKIDNLTKEIIVGPAYNLLKGM
ncbi:hypothetical protein Tco_0972117 [Tanacetum coccineum]